MQEARLAAAQVLSPLFAHMSTLGALSPLVIPPVNAPPHELAVSPSCSRDTPAAAGGKTVQAPVLAVLPGRVLKRRSGWQKALIGCAAM